MKDQDLSPNAYMDSVVSVKGCGAVRYFVVMNIYSEYFTKYALTLIGFRGKTDIYLTGRYIKTSHDRQELEKKAEKLNHAIRERYSSKNKNSSFGNP